MDSSGLSGNMKDVVVLWAMNLHVLHRPSLQRVIFGGEEGEVLGALTLARTRVSRRLRGRRYLRYLVSAAAAVSAPLMTILNNTLINFRNFSVNTVTKETTSKHKSTKPSMSHVKTLFTTNTKNPTAVPYLSLPTSQVYTI